jgi:hypothetical protein
MSMSSQLEKKLGAEAGRTFNHFHFALIFWTVFILVFMVHFYKEARDTLNRSEIIYGKVVDQVPVRMRRSNDKLRPQIEYRINDSTCYFVGRGISADNGERVKLIYEKGNPYKTIQVYSIPRLVDYMLILPYFLICFLIFRVICILGTRFKSKTVRLPSNRPL